MLALASQIKQKLGFHFLEWRSNEQVELSTRVMRYQVPAFKAKNF